MVEQLDGNQKLFLIAKYERDIDTYDLNNNVNSSQSLDIAQELSALDPQNTVAFRCMLANYRRQNDISRIENICRQILNTNSSPEMKINACVQLGDIYFDERKDKAEALNYVNQAISLARNLYTAGEIDRMVNGTNVEMRGSKLTGRSNVIRELYVLKNDLEGYPPQFKYESISEDYVLTYYKTYDIRYKTDWSADTVKLPAIDILSNKAGSVIGFGVVPQNSLIPSTFARQAAILEAYRYLAEMKFCDDGNIFQSSVDDRGNGLTKLNFDEKAAQSLYRHYKITDAKEDKEAHMVEVTLKADFLVKVI